MGSDRSESSGSALTPGQWVEIRGMSRRGRIIRLDEAKGQAELEVGDQTWKLDMERLRPAAEPEGAGAAEPDRGWTGPSLDHQYELDLHGLGVEEAIDALDKFLDSAIVNGLNMVKIIHGHGHGKVRQAVRTRLECHDQVREFHFGAPAQGGVAVTMVFFKS